MIKLPAGCEKMGRPTVIIADTVPAHPLLEGKREIGRGEYSIVLDKGDDERVYKIVSSPADYFLLTADDRPSGTHFPIVFADHGIVGRASSGYPFHLIEMEKLYPLDAGSPAEDLAKRLIDIYWAACEQWSILGMDMGRIALHQLAQSSIDIGDAMQESLATTQPTAAQVARLRLSADRFPRYLPLQSMLARSYLNAGANEDAATVAARLLELMPGNPDAAALATTIYRATRQWPLMKQAAWQWQRALHTETRPADIAIAEAAMKLGDFETVITTLEPHLATAVRAPEKNAALLRLVAGAMTANGQPERVEDLLGPLLAESSSARVTWLQVTATQAHDGLIAGEALARVSAVLDASSFEEVDSFARAASAVALRFADPAPARQAVGLLQSFTQRANPEVEALFLTAALQLQLNQYAAAEIAYREILSRQPKHDKALNDFAYLLLLRKGDLQEAKTAAAKARELRPQVATYHETFARIESELGNRPAALAAFDQALTIEPNNLDALIGKAFVLRESGRVQESEKLVTQIEPQLATSPVLSEPVRIQLQSLRKTTSRGE